MKKILFSLGVTAEVIIQSLVFLFLSINLIEGIRYAFKTTNFDQGILILFVYVFSLGLSVYWLIKKEYRKGTILFFVNIVALVILFFLAIRAIGEGILMMA